MQVRRELMCASVQDITVFVVFVSTRL